MITRVGPSAAELDASASILFWVGGGVGWLNGSLFLGCLRCAVLELCSTRSLCTMPQRRDAGYPRNERQAPFQPGDNSDRRRKGASQRHLNDHALCCKLLGAHRDRSISGDETRHAVCGCHSNFPAGLHRPSPGDGELLLDLTSAAVGGIVALHHQHLGATDQGPIDGLVISQFEADCVPDLEWYSGHRATTTSRTPGRVPATD
jgi:hypothetical protein